LELYDVIFAPKINSSSRQCSSPLLPTGRPKHTHPLPEPSETINLRNYNDKSQKDNCHNFRTSAGVFELADVADCEIKTKQKQKQN
jgi:hypothetical protein